MVRSKTHLAWNQLAVAAWLSCALQLSAADPPALESSMSGQALAGQATADAGHSAVPPPDSAVAASDSAGTGASTRSTDRRSVRPQPRVRSAGPSPLRPQRTGQAASSGQAATTGQAAQARQAAQAVAPHEQATPPKQQPSAQQQVIAAFQASRQAQSLQELAAVLQQCGRINRDELTLEHAEYLSQLMAWTHNKRGELISTQSEEAEQVDQLEEADRLEAEALREFHAALELDPKSWQARHNRGVSLATLGQLPEAIRDFDAAIQENPRYKNSWFNRAEIYYQLGQFDRAETDYGQVLELDRSDRGALEGRAHVRYELGKYELAMQDYDAAVNLDAADAETLVDRGNLHALLGEWQLAARDYRQAIKADKNYARGYQQAAWVMATCPEPRYRNPELAVKAAQKALELAGEGSDFRTWDTWAAALASAGRFDEAAEAQQKALALAPANARSELNVRLVSYQQDRPHEDRVRPASYVARAESANDFVPLGPADTTDPNPTPTNADTPNSLPSPAADQGAASSPSPLRPLPAAAIPSAAPLSGFAGGAPPQFAAPGFRSPGYFPGQLPTNLAPPTVLPTGRISALEPPPSEPETPPRGKNR